MDEGHHEGIAIIGMAGRFPGANSVEEFWANLVSGRESVSFFTDAELTASGLDPDALRRRGQYIAARGILADADCFDAAFFGIHPTEAEVMDPQQRLFLETCWSALERAGYAPNAIDDVVGVFAGATFNTYYLHVLHPRPALRELVGADLVMFGNEKDYLTTRVAYKLALKGPALNVSTACSTSLVAVAQACQSLLLHQCDLALAGGVSVTVPQARGYYHDEGQIGSADGHTRTFDARATGTAFGNGVGVVVLKRLDDAVRDGDPVYAVIKGAALNNDGAHRVSFGAPGVEGQSEVIAMAHALAGVEPASISYVEAHGTATPLGDPIEVAALTKAFRLGTDARQFCAIGSAKTNVGHLDVAAGVTGLIKTALSLHHRQLPASLHFTSPNPRLDLANSPFYVNASLQPWQAAQGEPRRAGVSSFGTGGTNAHVIVEEAPELPSSSDPASPWQLLVLSAKTEAALDRATENLAAHLRHLAADGDVAGSDALHQPAADRAAPPERAAGGDADGDVAAGDALHHQPAADRAARPRPIAGGDADGSVAAGDALNQPAADRAAPPKPIAGGDNTETAGNRAANLARPPRPEAGHDVAAQVSAARALADAAFTLHVGRSAFAHRRIVVCRDAADGAVALAAREAGRVLTQPARSAAPPVVFMFPGQGAQYAGMGAELYRTEPVFRAEVDRCADILRPLLALDLRALLFAGDAQRADADAHLRQTHITQPALFVIEYALAKLWMSWGITPAAMIGHSVGEYVAGCLADVFTLQDALSLVAYRGALVQAQPAGAMLAVRLAEHEVTPFLRDPLAIAAINAPNLCVVSGPPDAIAALAAELKTRDIGARALHTSHAFHSPMMDPVIAPFTARLRQVRLNEPRIPYVSNVTARWITAAEATSPDYWASHVREAVRFADGVAELLRTPDQALLEVGPGQTLATLARQHPSRAPEQIVVSSIARTDDERRTILDTLGKLWTAGAPVDWRAFHAHERRHRVALPTYPFERTRCWPASPVEETTTAAPLAIHPAAVTSALDAAAPGSLRADDAAARAAGAPASPTREVAALASRLDPQPELADAAASAAATPTSPTRDVAAIASPLAPQLALADAATVAATATATASAPPLAVAAPTVAAAAPAAPPRKDRLIERVRTTLQQMSGTSLDGVDPSVPFLEIGLDSLLLTQVGTKLQRDFGVKVSFRQLMEELSSLDAVASYIDAVLPPEVAQPVTLAPAAVAAPPQTGMAAGVSAAPYASSLAQAQAGAHEGAGGSAGGSADGSGGGAGGGAGSLPLGLIEQFLANQQQLTADLLAALRQHGGDAAALAAALPSVTRIATAPPSLANRGPAAPTAPATPRAPAAPIAASVPASASPSRPGPASGPGQKVSGPFRAIDTSTATGLTPVQQAFLDALIARYTARTQGSKRHTQAHRRHLADPRTMAGFRPYWKEMVYPLVIERSAGSRMWDIDGHEYIDFTMGFGTNLLGHSPAFVTEALAAQLQRGVEVGPQTPMAGEVARLMCELTGMERCAFCNTGSEAVLAAIRVSRTVTGRSLIVYFAGDYHGIFDEVLQRGMGGADDQTLMAIAPGIPAATPENVLILEYDRPESLDIIRRRGAEIAAVIVEPVQSRYPDAQPREFLRQLREVTRETGSALVFDEIITGFRSHPAGVQGLFGIQADIATYGKIIGGGMPIGAICGSATFLDALDGGFWQYGDASIPEAGVTFFAGTYVRHPLAVAGAHATLTHLAREGAGLQQRLNARVTEVVRELNAFLREQGAPLHIEHFASLFWVRLDPKLKYANLLFFLLRDKGIHIFEGRLFFLSTAHSDADVQALITAFTASIREMQAVGFLPAADARLAAVTAASLITTPVAPGVAAHAASQTPSSSESALLMPAMPAAAPIVASQALSTSESAWLPPAVPTPALIAARAAAPAASALRIDGYPSASTSAAATRTAPVQAPVREMKFGVYFFGNYPAPFAADKYQLMIDAARFADARGFSAIWVPERHFHAVGGFSPNPAVVAAALARETRQIQLRAGSVVLPLHSPIRVAEEWSVVDNLSHGRAGLSIASGWHPNDFVFAPGAYERRRELCTEGIDIIRALWAGQSIPVRGGTGEALDVSLYPMPMQRELPMWLTCVQAPSYEKAGELGCGVLAMLTNQRIEEVAEKIALYRQALERHGHDPAKGNVTLLVHTFVAATRDAAIAEARAPMRQYLRAYLDNSQKRHDAAGSGGPIAQEDLEYLLDRAFDDYVTGKALIGSPESCAVVVDRLREIGVDELGCFLDFGVDAQAVRDSLPHLDALRRLTNAAGTPSFASRQEAARPIAIQTAVDRTVPLTEAQQGLYLLAKMAPLANRAYAEVTTLRWRGALDIEVLHASIQSLVDRHEALRTTIDANGETQTVHAHACVDVPFVDLSTVGANTDADSDDDADVDADASAAAAAAAQRMALAEQFRDVEAFTFDLAQAPILRARVVRLAANEHLLLLTFHHILGNGPSYTVFFDELCETYIARRAGRAPQLAPAMQLSEYVRWQHDQRHDEAVEQDRAFWRAQFADAVPVLDLPADHPRAAIMTYRGHRQSLDIGPALTAALRATGGKLRGSLFMTLFAAFNVWLHRLSGQSDVVVGVPFESPVRGVPGGEHLFANTTSMVPLRSRLGDAPSFAALLAATKSLVLDANDHQAYFVGRLVQDLRIRPDLSRTPLFAASFNYESGTFRRTLGAGTGDSADTLDVELLLEDVPFANPQDASKFELTVNVADKGTRLRLDCDYNADLYDDETVARWLGHYHTLLAGIVANPAGSLDRLPLLTDAERADLIHATEPATLALPAALAREPQHDDEPPQPQQHVHAPAYEQSPPETLHGWFERQADATPDALAVTCDGRSLTYGDLNARANQVAHHLRGLGVAREVLVGLYVDRSIEMVIGLLGILKAGGAYLPIDPVYPRDRVVFMLDDARAPVVVTQAALAEALPAQQARIVCLDTDWPEIARKPTSNPPPHPAAGETLPGDLAYVIYTSGSTGTPKGTLVTHQNVARLMRATEPWFQFDATDVWTLFHSHAFDFSVWELWGALCYGGRVVIVPHRVSRSPEDFYALVVDERVTVLNQTPSAFKQFIEADARTGGRDALALRHVIFGGEALDMRSLAPWFARHGDRRPRLVNMYGITETTVHVTYRPLSAADVDGGSVIGTPIPDLQLYLLDRHQEPVPIGVVGEIHVGGAGVARGYLHREALTRERFVPDTFSTQPGAMRYRSGDLARRLPNGDLEYVGRIDDQVKLRGFRIELGEIETALSRHDAIKQAVVLAREDTPGDKRLVAYLELAPASHAESVAARANTANATAPALAAFAGSASSALTATAARASAGAAVAAAGAVAEAPAVDALRAFLEKTLPPYMVPAAFVTVSAWPLTAHGKLDRQALPAPSDARPALESAFVAPRTAAEQRLAAIWRDLLGVQQIGARDNFFDLGGHSLLAMRLVTRVHQEFGVRLPPGALFEHAVLAELAECIDPNPIEPATGASLPETTSPAAPVSASAPPLVPVATAVAGVTQDVHTAAAAIATAAAPAHATVSASMGSMVAGTVPGAGPEAVTLSIPLAPAKTATLTARPSQDNVLFQIAPSIGGGTPFFWVHGVGGEVFSYVKLSQHLSAARPVFGFAADWTQLAGHDMPTLEVIAAHYVRELRRQQPAGPYHLGGFCSAAMLALEMARQLEAAGQAVGVLAAVDYDVIETHASASSIAATVAFWRNLPRWIREDAMHSDLKDMIGRIRSRLRRISAWFRASPNGQASTGAATGNGDLRDRLGMWRFPDYMVAMLHAHQQAIDSYQPKPFAGRVTLFRPRTAPLLGPWPKGYDRAWHDLAEGGVEAHEIHGSHVTMLTDPFAAELAVRLNAAIEKAERQAKMPLTS
jgi:natural product biosynthesis luciferase-like monooxygenase protein/amino acid adenylation domain-containing protein